MIMTPPESLRLGNWMYLWLNAHKRTRAGMSTLVLEAPGMSPWLDAFPELSRLTISKDELRFHDRRESFGAYRQRFGVDFTREDLCAFIADALVPVITPDVSGTLVINVRRGDYYTVPDLIERYAFDQIGYIGHALDQFAGVERAMIVSDDPRWCRDNLHDLVSASIPTVDFAATDPVSNFLTLASAGRIIGSNSTFSYWGAYVAGVLHEDAEIVMPRFHARQAGSTDSYQLDPRWSVIAGFHELGSW